MPSTHKLTHPYGGLQDIDPRHSEMHPIKIPNTGFTWECFTQSNTHSHEYSRGHIDMHTPPIPSLLAPSPSLHSSSPYTQTHIFPLEHLSLHPLQPQGAQAYWSGSKLQFPRKHCHYHVLAEPGEAWGMCWMSLEPIWSSDYR